MKQLRRHSLKPIIITLLAIVVLGLGTFFGARTIYNQGVYDGRIEYEKTTAESLTTLATAISAKSDFIKNSNQLLADTPTEITEETIDTYIKNLTTLNDSTPLDSVKTLLTDHIKKWQDFKTIYSSKDNDAITTAFDELRTDSVTTVTKIQEAYDEQITTALKALSSD